MTECKVCRNGVVPDKGRAPDGRRAYRCRTCGCVWTEGLQGKKQSWNPQRQQYQFADTGAHKGP
jgi:hypothetical protein